MAPDASNGHVAPANRTDRGAVATVDPIVRTRALSKTYPGDI